MIEFKKDMIGKTIFGEPTGNNARRSSDLKKFKVISIKRKYVELESESGYTDMYDKVQGHTQSDFNNGWMNSGYKFFESEADYEKDLEKRKMIKEISEFIGYGNGLKTLATFDEVEGIYDIIQPIIMRKG